MNKQPLFLLSGHIVEEKYYNNYLHVYVCIRVNRITFKTVTSNSAHIWHIFYMGGRGKKDQGELGSRTICNR